MIGHRKDRGDFKTHYRSDLESSIGVWVREKRRPEKRRVKRCCFKYIALTLQEISREGKGHLNKPREGNGVQGGASCCTLGIITLGGSEEGDIKRFRLKKRTGKFY